MQRSSLMKPFRSVALVSLGALAMYFFDPQQGHRRRALFFDQFRKRYHRATGDFQNLVRDFRYRARGLVHKMSQQISRAQQEIPDPVLEARVRSKIGRYRQHHPHTFEIKVDQGRVLIVGQISDALYQRIYPVIRRMPGVVSLKKIGIAA
ncbi:MAG: hypothetical protein RJB38_2428 [Pseudomonadota bacterium]